MGKPGEICSYNMLVLQDAGEERKNVWNFSNFLLHGDAMRSFSDTIWVGLFQ